LRPGFWFLTEAPDQFADTPGKNAHGAALRPALLQRNTVLRHATPAALTRPMQQSNHFAVQEPMMSANTAALAAAGRTESRNTTIPTLAGVFASFVLRVRAYRTRQADRAMLYSMGDRALKDIGLSRCDIDRLTSM
jgi:uncharacterized protein YjiS (DUF1127 family)